MTMETVTNKKLKMNQQGQLPTMITTKLKELALNVLDASNLSQENLCGSDHLLL